MIFSTGTWNLLKTTFFPVNNSSVAKKIGLILSDEDTSAGLEAMFSGAGYDVVVEVEKSCNLLGVKTHPVDAWVFDARSETLFDVLSETGKFLLPADNAPRCANEDSFQGWSAGLLKQIDSAMTEESQGKKTATNFGPGVVELKSVWVLAGSAGATTAIQTFLNTFRSPPPVGFIYAQHYAIDERRQLARLTAENPVFSIDVADGVHNLAPGKVLMVPPHCRITIDDFGRVSSTRSDWGQQYTPDIEELLIILTAANLPSTGVIFFSGMGRDGVGALRVLDSAGARIWAQSPCSAVCGSMPQGAIDTGLVHRTGDPEQLAKSLEQLYN